MSSGTRTSSNGTPSWSTPAAAAPPPLPSTDLPKIPPILEGTLHLPTATAAQLVVFYSQVYAHWDGQVKACKEAGDTSSATYQWAVYYSDLSSRAAHHYNAIKDVAAPRSLGTATSTMNASGGGGSSSSSTNHVQSCAPSSSSPAVKGPPVSFQNYALECIRQCTNETQRNSMKELIELTIRKSLQDGSMYTKNWKAEPLLPLYQQHQQQQQQQRNQSGKKSYASIVSNNSNVDSVVSTTSKSKSGTIVGGSSRSGGMDSTAASVTSTDFEFQLKPNPKNSNNASSYLSHHDHDTAHTSPRKRKQKQMEESSYYGPCTTSDQDTWDDESWPSTKQLNSKSKNKKKEMQKSKDKTSPASSTFDALLASEPNYISLTSLSSPNKPYEKQQQHHPFLKKRKVATMSTESKTIHRNAHKDGFDASASKLASRANRFSGRGGLTAAISNDLHQEYARGVEKYMGKSVIGGGMSSSSWNGTGEGKKLQPEDYEQMTVKGTCQVLEKEFLRLTAPPRADLVRPQPVLEQHLENILELRKKIKSGKNIRSGDEKDYNWFCSQLKAIRQDMTVQRIFNAFAVKVYESHARIALEEGDMNEYNQSQTQLKELYELLSSHKSVKEEGNGLQNQNEFIAYRIIYHVFLTGNKKYEGGSSDLFKIMLHLTYEQKRDPLISHALKVRVAVADNDYNAFFRLCNECTNHGKYLLDKIVPQIRSAALKCTMKAYRPSVATDFILSQLGFALDHKRQKREAIGWLKSCGCKFSDDKSSIIAKESILDETFMTGAQKSSLI